MGYWTRLYLIDIKIKEDSRARFARLLKKHKSFSNETLKYFLDEVVLDSDGFLGFKAGDYDAYMPDEEGIVPAKDAKWYKSESIAECLKNFCEEGGSIVEHSLEADGAAWGWEFDGKGRMRELELRPVGKWI